MISGYFSARWGCPFVWTRLAIPGRPPQPVPFLIDTGSSTSIVHAKDARVRLNLATDAMEPAAWTPEETVRRRGVAGVALSRQMEATFEFTHDDGSLQTIAETIELGAVDSQQLPSLMGWDLLRRFRIELEQGTGTVTLLPQ